jgi:hypothetical protein
MSLIVQRPRIAFLYPHESEYVEHTSNVVPHILYCNRVLAFIFLVHLFALKGLAVPRLLILMEFTRLSLMHFPGS